MNDLRTDPEIKLPNVRPWLQPGVPFVVESFGMTDRGQVRPANEDHFLVAELARMLRVHHTSLPEAKPHYSSHRGHMFVVADGMGGHSAGEVASALGVVTIEAFVVNALRRFFNLKPSEEQNVMKDFQHALAEADHRIFEETARHPEMMGMGTTMTLAFAVGWTLYVAHVGDSRCYLFSQGRLQQLTQDHTMAAEMVRRGILSEDQAAMSRYRNVVTNVLGGTEPGVKPEVHQVDLEPGDMVLVCSDGLTGMVSDERIADLLSDGTPQSICERLVAEANAQGGRDNITVLVARFSTE